MRISAKALAVASGLLWGGGVAFTALIHLAVPSYGSAFLGFLGSIYPGFHAAHSLGDALVGISYALVEGFVGGLVFAWLYNASLARAAGHPADQGDWRQSRHEGWAERRRQRSFTMCE